MIHVHRINKSYNEGDIISTNHGKCLIVKIISYKEVKIKFIKTGYETITRMTELKRGSIKDMLAPSVCGIGYLGKNFVKIKKENKKLFKKTYQVWIDMIKRCYDINRAGYTSYGKKGVKVSDRWLNFSKFYKDIQKLEGFNMNDFINSKIFLDKDKLQLNKPHSERIYSKDTCVFLSRRENNLLQDYSDQLIKFKVFFPDGHTEIHEGIRKFAKDNNMYFTNISACLKGKQKTYKSYKFEYYKE